MCRQSSRQRPNFPKFILPWFTRETVIGTSPAFIKSYIICVATGCYHYRAGLKLRWLPTVKSLHSHMRRCNSETAEKTNGGGSYLQLHSESFQELCVHGIVIDRAGSPSTRTYCDSSCGFDGCIRVRRRDDFPYAFAIGYLIGWRYANLRNL